MAIAFMALGMMFVLAAMSDHGGQLLAQLESDLIGPGGFFVWGGLLIAIYVIGKITGLEKTSQGFIFLLIGVYIVKHASSFSNISGQLSSVQPAAPTTPQAQGAAEQVNPQTGAAPNLSTTATTPSVQTAAGQMQAITPFASSLPIFALNTGGFLN